MNIEIISIGDELLIGQTINTNASWMGSQLMDIDLPPKWVTTVGDDAVLLKNALEIAESRADVLLITGGLGPTHDDITKKIVCDFYDSSLIMHEETLERVKERFLKRGIKMVKINEEQALVPEKATIINNDLGTAPGFMFNENPKLCFVMPGVPKEMKAMMTDFVLPLLAKKSNSPKLIRKILCTTGIPESTLYEKLGDMHELEKLAKIAFLPNLFGVRLRLTSSGSTEVEANDALVRAEQYIRAKVGDYIFAEGDTSLEEAVAELLIKKGKTLAVAESCTGGLISNKLTNVSGSSTFFERGFITYSNKAKMELLNVPLETLESVGAVSPETAQIMAEQARLKAQTDIAVSVTGIAGPNGGTAEKPVGLVYIGYADENGSTVEKHNFANDRIGNKDRTVQAALNLIRKKVLGMQ